MEIKDFAAPGAYGKALEGEYPFMICSGLGGPLLTYIVYTKNASVPSTGVVGVAHIATDVSFSSGDVNKVVGQAVDATIGLLEAAAQVPEVKAFVLTSSRAAVYNPQYGKDAEWSLTDFADYLYDVAQQAADDDPSKPFLACEPKHLDLLFAV